VKLLDFGLAKVPDVSLTTPGVTPGTIAYMSPEQLRGASVGARSDLWSLGVVLCEMLTGVHPFRAANDGPVIHAPLDARTASTLKYHPGTPGSLQRIIARLLREQQEARYANAGELLSDLQSLLPGTAEVPRSRRSPAWRRRALVAGIGVLVLGGAVVWLGRTPVPVATTRASAAAMLERDAPVASAKTLAVLPFTNLSADPEEDYFSDGLTEELIGVLSRVRALRVAARTSSFAFKGQNRDIRDIGRALNVRAVLEGSVRREGDRLRVSAQLVDVDDGFPIWSETYDRQLADVFAIQRDLAVRIAAALEAELTPGERERLALRPTASSQAFALYLKGRYFWNQRTSASFIRAIEYYERAIDADPRYAAPHAGLAIVYSVQGMWGDLVPSEARTRMKAAALEAVRLDDGLAEAHAVLGAYMHLYEWDSEAAEREQLRAIELDPGYADARHFYGNFLRATDRIQEAVAQKKWAVELDPLVPVLSSSLGISLLAAGHHDEALEHIRSALELDSMSWQTHEHLGSFHETTGRLTEALLAYRKAVELARAAPYRSTPDVARVLARLGQEEEARQMLNELQAEAAHSGVHSPVVATVLFALGDTDAAFDWLEKSYHERHPRLRFMNGLPAYADMSGAPQFRDLLRRIGVRP
jgi:serine/threonine-protein kinase